MSVFVHLCGSEILRCLRQMKDILKLSSICLVFCICVFVFVWVRNIEMFCDNRINPRNCLPAVSLYKKRSSLERCSLTKTYYWHIYLICGTFSLEPTSQYVYFRTILGVEMTPNTSICEDLLTKYEEIGQDPLWQCASLKKST